MRAASDDNERAMLLATERRALFTAELGEDADVRAGQPVRLAVDSARFHFFDLESGDRL